MSPYEPRSARKNREKEVQKEKIKKKLDWVQVILVAVVLAVLIRIFVYEPSNVSGPSMQSTLHTGDLILTNKFIYDTRDPQRGEIIVFHATADADFIKRVIGVAGDRIRVKNNQLFINDKPVAEPYIDKSNRTLDFAEVTVPPGKVFVMGDNRLNSTDSRIIGPVSLDKIVGRADLVYWPLSDMRFLP